MALITCSQCGKSYSEHAEKCPQCGTPRNISQKTENRLKIGKIILVIAAITFAIGGIIFVANLFKSSKNSPDNRHESSGHIEAYDDNEMGGQDIEYLAGVIIDEDGYTNIRAGQSTKTDILGTLSDGEEILYKNVPEADWLEVYNLDGVRLGYVHSSRVVPDRVEPKPGKIENGVFTSPDLKWARVHGHVKKVTEIYDNDSDMAETFYFDKTGKFVRLEMGDMLIGDGNMVRRNNAGQIIWMGSKEGNQDKFKYDKDGYVIEWRNSDCDWGTGDDYTVNKKGWILTKEDCPEQTDDSEHCKGTYTYSKIDEQGNWIEAKVKYVCTDYDGGGTSTGTSTTTRKIVYWE